MPPGAISKFAFSSYAAERDAVPQKTPPLSNLPPDPLQKIFEAIRADGRQMTLSFAEAVQVNKALGAAFAKSRKSADIETWKLKKTLEIFPNLERLHVSEDGLDRTQEFGDNLSALKKAERVQYLGLTCTKDGHPCLAHLPPNLKILELWYPAGSIPELPEGLETFALRECIPKSLPAKLPSTIRNLIVDLRADQLDAALALFERTESLESLYLTIEGTPTRQQLANLAETQKLEELALRDPAAFDALTNIDLPTSLKKLCLTVRAAKINEAIEKFPDLSALCVEDCPSAEHFTTLLKARKLDQLILKNCYRLEPPPGQTLPLPENLRSFKVTTNPRGNIFKLPGSLREFYATDWGSCSQNPSPPKLPDGLEILELNSCEITSFPTPWPKGLKQLHLGNCHIPELPPPTQLPDTVEAIKIWHCHHFPALPGPLPAKLRTLNLSFCNQLETLPDPLPVGLAHLILTEMASLQKPPRLPAGLSLLDVRGSFDHVERAPKHCLVLTDPPAQTRSTAST